MSSYKSFAVAGAGLIGTPIVAALLAKGASVVVLSRSEKPAPAGASAAVVDYTDVPALTETLKKHAVDVVVATFSPEGLDAQPPLADAAKAAGARLFVSSEYGGPSEGAKDGMLARKDALTKHCRAIGLPTARIYTGFFTSFIPWLTGIDVTGKTHIMGSGNVVLSTTADDDIVGFVAHILTELPHEEVADKEFRLEGDRGTMREIAALFGTPVVEHVEPPSELSPLHGFFLQLVEAGHANTGWDHAAGKDVGSGGSGNAAWPGHHWKTMKEFHNLK